jgi:hypothetical protein
MVHVSLLCLHRVFRLRSLYRIKCDGFLLQHYAIYLCNGQDEACSLREMKYSFVNSMQMDFLIHEASPVPSMN